MSPVRGQRSGPSIGSFVVSIAALVLANLVTVAGVVLFGWSLMQILVVFWIESAIVGLLNVPKIAMARGGATATELAEVGRSVATKAFLVPFFIFHYGLFWVVHGVFLWTLPLTAQLWSDAPFGSTSPDFGRVDGGEVLYATVVLLASHVVSFVVHYVARKEYLQVTANQQMFAVYGRVAVLHAVILAGGLVVGRLGSPLGILAVLVGGKVVLDVLFHYNEHRKQHHVPPEPLPQTWAAVDTWGSTPQFDDGD